MVSFLCKDTHFVYYSHKHFNCGDLNPLSGKSSSWKIWEILFNVSFFLCFSRNLFYLSVCFKVRHWRNCRNASERILFCFYLGIDLAFPCGSNGKESACNAGDLGLITGLGRSPGGEHCTPLKYFCLKSPMGRGAWWAIVHGAQTVWHDGATKHSTWIDLGI